MKEYKLIVRQDNKKETLKSYADSVEEAIDNMILIDSVSHLYLIEEVESKEQWEFNEELNGLRELRKLIPSDVRLAFEVRSSEWH
tara:strand:+ start:1385 stop:1639 length:255 start_codon:yes stop_codon:yes gene_type:complete